MSKATMLDAEYTTTEYIYPNAVVRVHHPIISDDERAKREKCIRRALIRFGEAILRSPNADELIRKIEADDGSI